MLGRKGLIGLKDYKIMMGAGELLKRCDEQYISKFTNRKCKRYDYRSFYTRYYREGVRVFGTYAQNELPEKQKQSAINWLMNVQEENGSWYGKWGFVIYMVRGLL